MLRIFALALAILATACINAPTPEVADEAAEEVNTINSESFFKNAAGGQQYMLASANPSGPQIGFTGCPSNLVAGSSATFAVVGSFYPSQTVAMFADDNVGGTSVELVYVGQVGPYGATLHSVTFQLPDANATGEIFVAASTGVVTNPNRPEEETLIFSEILRCDVTGGDPTTSWDDLSGWWDDYFGTSIDTGTPVDTDVLDTDDTGAPCAPTWWRPDIDDDGFADYSQDPVYSCEPPAPRWTHDATQADCNDNITAINPDATEVCGNGVDENCNPSDDECPDDTGTPTPQQDYFCWAWQSSDAGYPCRDFQDLPVDWWVSLDEGTQPTYQNLVQGVQTCDSGDALGFAHCCEVGDSTSMQCTRGSFRVNRP